jgi:hypothetical protein
VEVIPRPRTFGLTGVSGMVGSLGPLIPRMWRIGLDVMWMGLIYVSSRLVGENYHPSREDHLCRALGGGGCCPNR